MEPVHAGISEAPLSTLDKQWQKHESQQNVTAPVVQSAARLGFLEEHPVPKSAYRNAHVLLQIALSLF